MNYSNLVFVVLGFTLALSYAKPLHTEGSHRVKRADSGSEDDAVAKIASDPGDPKNYVKFGENNVNGMEAGGDKWFQKQSKHAEEISAQGERARLEGEENQRKIEKSQYDSLSKGFKEIDTAQKESIKMMNEEDHGANKGNSPAAAAEAKDDKDDVKPPAGPPPADDDDDDD